MSGSKVSTAVRVMFSDSEPGRSIERADTEMPANSLERLFDAHFEALWRFVRRLGVAPDSVEDAVQEVFTIFARRIAEIEPGAEKSFLFGTS